MIRRSARKKEVFAWFCDGFIKFLGQRGIGICDSRIKKNGYGGSVGYFAIFVGFKDP